MELCQQGYGKDRCDTQKNRGSQGQNQRRHRDRSKDQDVKRVMQAAGQIQQQRKLQQIKQDHKQIFCLGQALIFGENEHGDQVAHHGHADHQKAQTHLDLQAVSLLRYKQRNELPADRAPAQKDNCAQAHPVPALAALENAKFHIGHLRAFVPLHVRPKS